MRTNDVAANSLAPVNSKRIFNHRLNLILDEIDTKKVTLENIIDFCVLAMQVVNAFEDMRGAEKKEMVIYAMYCLAGSMHDQDDPDSWELWNTLTAVVVETLPSVIDYLFLVEDKQLTLRKPLKKSLGRARRVFNVMCCGARPAATDAV
jgi:hypothetical protein